MDGGSIPCLHCPDEVDSGSACVYHLRQEPATEQILARPYQREPQRAEGEEEETGGRGEEEEEVLLRDAANDHPC